MKTIGAFLLGLFSGWLVKSMIAEADWRHRIQALASENAFLKDRIRSLEVQIKSKSLEAKSRSRPVTQPVERSRPVETDTGKDDLKLLTGVGARNRKTIEQCGNLCFCRRRSTHAEGITGAAWQQRTRLREQFDRRGKKTCPTKIKPGQEYPNPVPGVTEYRMHV
jgi:hypothetical protein